MIWSKSYSFGRAQILTQVGRLQGSCYVNILNVSSYDAELDRCEDEVGLSDTYEAQQMGSRFAGTPFPISLSPAPLWGLGITSFHPRSCLQMPSSKDSTDTADPTKPHIVGKALCMGQLVSYRACWVDPWASGQRPSARVPRACFHTRNPES